jgi:hypothetical protein
VKVGDLVRWSPIEAAYHKSCFGSAGLDLTSDRKCGIIVDRNPTYVFVFWQNKELLAQLPNSIEVIK